MNPQELKRILVDIVELERTCLMRVANAHSTKDPEDKLRELKAIDQERALAKTLRERIEAL